MSKGLHAYFKKYQWSNTTLPDFVSSLEQAWKETGDSSLGSDFSLARWCDEWLTSSGINIIEPLNQDGNGLSIKQSLGLRGKNRLRKQKFDISLFNQVGQQHVIRNVVISEKDEITGVEMSSLPKDFTIAAIYLNEG